MSPGLPAATAEELRAAIRAEPGRAELHHELGLLLLRQGDAGAAAESLAEAARLAPDWFEAVANHGVALDQLGQLPEAEARLRAALALRPDSEPVLTALAGVLHKMRRSPEAAAVAEQAVRVAPGSPEAWINLGVALRGCDRLAEAGDAYRRALALRPGDALAHYNLGQVLQDSWQGELALPKFAEAIRLDPGYAPAWHAFLFNSLFDASQTEQSIFENHRRWAEHLDRQGAAAAPARRRAAGARRLRVGYVSPDFRRHSCSHFLQPLLAHHDRGAFEVFAYSVVQRPDPVTGWFRDHAEHWRDARGLDEARLASLIRDDAIDVLVDLAGHTAHQPLGVFRLQPAPVQVAWLGYPATTGLARIQYRFTDALADPPGEPDRWHSEKLIRLPDGFLCYQAPADAPAVAPLPAGRTGQVTFGSFNNISKVTAPVVHAWSEILRRLPGSRLLLKGRMLAHELVSQRVAAAFSAAGIEPARLILRGWAATPADSLAAYAEVDVALDTFPFNGATTTLEALWMGVPVVTLRGARHAGRVGASVLTHLGKSAWIADDAQRYVDTAVGLASDPARLSVIREGLRGELSRSPLTDGAAFARKLERAYRELSAPSGR